MDKSEYTTDDAKTLWQEDLSDATAADSTIKATVRATLSRDVSSIAGTVRESDQTTAQDVLGGKDAPPKDAGWSSFPHEASPPAAREAEIGEIPDPDEELRLIRKLGEGGMGVVYSAHQVPLGRQVAVKMMKPQYSSDQNLNSRFCSEAVLTGLLDHPNVVPVHKLGKTADGKFFYVMKEIKGTNWKEVIGQKTEGENLEILLRVCDAMSFSHSRTIIHRDLKPENILLGDFGEVLVLDWGIALFMGENRDPGVFKESGRAGTPAFMAPEMARCEYDLIGFCSDIYLLGAILFQIVTGFPPHRGANVWMVLASAANNRIYETDKEGELLEIAKKAMATEPQDRYATVQDFQKAVKNYLAHQESVAVEKSAREYLAKAGSDYDLLARATFAFEEAQKLWPENSDAWTGALEARFSYSRTAFEKGDYDLALSILRPEIPKHAALQIEVETARQNRLSRERTLQRLRVSFMIALIFMVLGLGVFVSVIQREYEKTRKESTFATLFLAEKRVLEGEMESAFQLLESVAPALRSWEWGRVRYLLRSVFSEKLMVTTFRAFAFSSDGTFLALGHKYGKIVLIDLPARKVRETIDVQSHVVGLSFQGENKLFAATERSAKPELFDLEKRKSVDLFVPKDFQSTGNETPISLALFFPDGKTFLTDGKDGIVLRNIETPNTMQVFDKIRKPYQKLVLTPCGNMLMVVQDTELNIYAVPSGEPGQRIISERPIQAITASHDDKKIVVGDDQGMISVFDADSGKKQFAFQAHKDKILALDISPDGERMISGSADKSVKVWNKEGRLELSFLEHRVGVVATGFTPDGKMAFSVDSENMVYYWDISETHGISSFVLPSDTEPPYLFSPDGKKLFSGGALNKGTIWNAETGMKLLEIPAQPFPISYAEFSQRAELLLTHIAGFGARVWGCETGGLLLDFPCTDAEVSVFSPGENHLWTFAGATPSAIIGRRYRLATGNKAGEKTLSLQKTGQFPLDSQKNSSPLNGRFYGGQGLVSADSQTMHLWGLGSDNIPTESGHVVYEAPRNCAITAHAPGKLRAAIGLSDNTIQIIDGKTGQPLILLSGHKGPITFVRFAPGAGRLLSGSADRTMKLWDPLDGREVYTFRDLPETPIHGVFSQEASFIRVVCRDRSVITIPIRNWNQ